MSKRKHRRIAGWLPALMWIAFSAIIAQPAAAQTQEYSQVLTAVADTYVIDPADEPPFPRGGEERLIVAISHVRFMAYLRFDVLGSLPADATIRRATLRMYCQNATSDSRDGRYSMQLSQVLGPWSEATLVLQNRPAAGGIASRWRVRDCDFASGGSWQEQDLTALTTEWHDRRAAEHGVELVGTENGRVDFASRESGAFAPVLEVVYLANPSPTSPPSATPSATSSPTRTSAPTATSSLTATSVPTPTVASTPTPSPTLSWIAFLPVINVDP